MSIRLINNISKETRPFPILCLLGLVSLRYYVQYVKFLASLNKNLWIPGHVRIVGNENADLLASEPSLPLSNITSVPYSEFHPPLKHSIS